MLVDRRTPHYIMKLIHPINNVKYKIHTIHVNASHNFASTRTLCICYVKQSKMNEILSYLISQLIRFLGLIVTKQFKSVSHIHNFHPVPDIFKGIKSWPDVKQGKLILVVNLPSIIVINYITDILSTPVHNPVMAIKGKFISVTK